jgi:hypothetical protein
MWTFRGEGDVRAQIGLEGPQPSSRAAVVLDLVGVDWRKFESLDIAQLSNVSKLQTQP